MAKKKVQLADNVKRVIFLEVDATIGATIGTDLKLPDGSIPNKEQLAAYLGISPSTGNANHHRLLLGLTLGDDHPQYTRKDTLTTRGDLYYRNASTVARLALGSTNQLLRSNGTDPVYVTISPTITLSTDLSGSVTLTDLASGTLASTIVNNAVTDAKLRDSVGVSVIGRSANTTGDPADIVASSDGDVLRRSGTTLGFGAIPESSVTNLVSDLAARALITTQIIAGAGLTGGGTLAADRTLAVGAGTGITVNADDVAITTNGVTDALLRQSAAVSLIGRSANSTGNVADISASADDQILRRTGSTLNFGQLTVGMFPNDVVTYAKIQNISATSRVLGRVSSGAGDTEELTLSQVLDFVGSAANGDILYRSGGSWTRLGIGSSTQVLTVTGGLPTWAAAGGGGGGSPGGSDGQLQYNNGGSFGGVATFTYDDGSGAFSLTPSAIDIITTGGMINIEIPGGLSRDATLNLSVSPNSLAELGAEETNIYGDNSISLISNTLQININLMGSGTIELQGEVDFDNGGTAIPGSAGAADPLPSNPAGYLYIKVQGSDYLMPFYNR